MASYFSLAAAVCFLAILGTTIFYWKSRSHQENKTVASSSLTLVDPPPSSLPRNWIHHVFPSFHGADVRKTFLSHVLKEFKSKGIDLFIDKDIERSKSIGPALLEAIRGSRIAIVLLSKNYASSTWCLNELVEIIKCRKEFGQTLMPIFYQVNPTDIKKQTGDFGKVFRNTCKGKTEEEIRRWKHALTEVAQIAGHHSKNWDTEAEMIEDIASGVSNKLNNSAPSGDFYGLVGMESHMTKIGPLLKLDSNEVRKIGIWGPPGIGKSTIARSLFNRHSQDFQLSVFMDNIKRKHAIMACSDDYSVKLDLQKQFMSRLTNEKDIKIPHLGIAKDRLKDKKVLVVLDDVDRPTQVEAIAKETCWFGPGSRVIVTAQDQKVLKSSGINHIHMVDLPSYDEALQIFCMYAFGQEWCKDGFRNLALEVISLIGRLPLGLRVVGSYFRGMSEQDWREALPRLRTHLDRDGEIASILKFSYDALRDEEKRLFLHIACFFHGERVDVVEGCLAKCFLDVTQGVCILAEKSLISINMGTIDMAELLVDLGRKIVREQSVSEPGKRQFLNEPVDIGEVLSDDKSDSRSVIGISLVRNKDITWTSEIAFERFSNLQFLKINTCVNSRSIKYISRKLRVLIWLNFQMSCFPSSFNPEFLVKLDMRHGNLEKLWKKTQPLKNLKWMNLTFSKSLKELPDLSTATNLHDLDLSYCSSLVKLPSSIGNAINLQKLNMRFCSSLVRIPSSMGNIVYLQVLDLSYCSSLVRLPSSVGNIVSLQKFNLSHCSRLVELPFSIGNIVNLRKLNLKACSRLVKLPSTIGNAINLQKLNLSYCQHLMELPSSIGNMVKLRILKLECCSSLVELPFTIGNATSLKKLDLKCCSSLVRLPLSIGNAINLQELYLNCCSSLVELPASMEQFRRLMVLELQKCSKLEVNLANFHLESFEEFDLSECSSLKRYSEIKEIVPWIGGISRLKTLKLRGMKELVSLPQLPDSLLELDAQNCEFLERLDCSFRNPGISLNFANCFKLNQEAKDLIILTPSIGYAVFPAEEVPTCFTYRSSGSSLTVKLNQMPLGKSTKFKACIICAGDDDDVFRRRGEVCIHCSITSGGNALTFKEVDRFLPGHLHTFVVEVETEELVSTELVFEFDIGYSDYYDEDYDVEQRINKTWEIIECGMLQLLDLPLLSFRQGS